MNFSDPFGLKDFTREQLETALGKVKWGQQVAFESAKLGIRPQDTPTAKGKKLELANPVKGSSDPVIDAFEKSLGPTLQALGVHILGQVANVVDEAVLDKPGNFYNYWGMVEVWRHQKLIDKIQKLLDKMPKPQPTPPEVYKKNK